MIFKPKVCSALREALEEEHRNRMEAVNSKFIPLTITDEPSRKVHCIIKVIKFNLFKHLQGRLILIFVFAHQANYKINAMRIMFDLHTFKQKKIYQNMRAEQEMSVRYFLRIDIYFL